MAETHLHPEDLRAGDLVKYSVYPYTNDDDGSEYFSAVVVFNEDEERLVLQTYIESEVRQFMSAGVSTFCDIENAHRITLRARIW